MLSIKRTLPLLILALGCLAFVAKHSFADPTPPQDLEVKEIKFEGSGDQVKVMVQATIHVAGPVGSVVNIPDHPLHIKVNDQIVGIVGIDGLGPDTLFFGECGVFDPQKGCIPGPCLFPLVCVEPQCECIGDFLGEIFFKLKKGDRVTAIIDPEDVVNEWAEGNNELTVSYTYPDVPTLTEWGLIVLALLLLTATVWMLWRRRREATA